MTNVCHTPVSTGLIQKPRSQQRDINQTWDPLFPPTAKRVRSTQNVTGLKSKFAGRDIHHKATLLETSLRPRKATSTFFVVVFWFFFAVICYELKQFPLFCPKQDCGESWRNLVRSAPNRAHMKKVAPCQSNVTTISVVRIYFSRI